MNKTALAIGAFFVIGGGAAIWNTVASPTAPPEHSMTPPDTRAVAAGAPLVDVALPAELSAEAQIGARAFEAKCAVCHGENAAGQNGVAPPLVHRIYEPSHHADMAFVMAARNGVRSHHWTFGNMPPVEGLTDADLKAIVRYVRELQEANGIF
jgi:mono/diheme cytochrome c family protein